MPAIASVDGGDFGGGNELVIARDLTIAAERAQFGERGEDGRRASTRRKELVGYDRGGEVSRRSIISLS